MQTQMQTLSVHSTIEILSIDTCANADADTNAQWERTLSL